MLYSSEHGRRILRRFWIYSYSYFINAGQGALLLVDATKGVQAQTVANFWLAFEQNLVIQPVASIFDRIPRSYSYSYSISIVFYSGFVKSIITKH